MIKVKKGRKEMKGGRGRCSKRKKKNPQKIDPDQKPNSQLFGTRIQVRKSHKKTEGSDTLVACIIKIPMLI